MAAKTFHLELRVYNVETEEHMDALKHALKSAGRGLHAKAMLICGNEPEPEIKLFGQDFAKGKSPILLAEDE